MNQSLSFTVKSNGGLLNSLRTKCIVSQSFNPQTENIECDHIEFEGLWDTGATGSVITDRVAKACGLQPISMTEVHGVGGIHTSNVYLVNIILPNKLMYYEVRVTEGNLPNGTDLLFGMDIISTGDFSVTNMKENTVFSFRQPSQHHIDYVESDNKNLLNDSRSHGGIKRTKPRIGKTFGKNKRKK